MKTLSGPVHCIIDCMRMCVCNLVEFVVIVTQSNDIATNGFENVILFGGTHSQRTTPHFCNPMNEWIHWYTWMAIKSIPHRMKLSFCIFFSFTAILENNQQQPNETIFIFEWEFLLLLLLFTLWSQLVCWWIKRNAQLPPTNYKNVEKFNVFLLWCMRVCRLNDNLHWLFDVCDSIAILNGCLFGSTIRCERQVIFCQCKICMYMVFWSLFFVSCIFVKHQVLLLANSVGPTTLWQKLSQFTIPLHTNRLVYSH